MFPVNQVHSKAVSGLAENIRSYAIFISPTCNRSSSTSMKRVIIKNRPISTTMKYMKSIFIDNDYLLLFECVHCVNLTSLMVTVKISVTHLNPLHLQCFGELKYKTLDSESSCSTSNLQMSPAPIHRVSVYQAKPRVNTNSCFPHKSQVTGITAKSSSKVHDKVLRAYFPIISSPDTEVH